jgi:hypothetical protein
MDKRMSIVLFLLPAVLFGLLLFLSHTMVASSSGWDDQVLLLPGAPLLQGATEVEPNDTIGTANPIVVNLTMAGTIPIVQPGDIDWYRLILPSTDLSRDFRATLEEVLPDADYKLELNLYDSEGSLVESVTSGSSMSVDWSSSVITYFLRVRAVEFDVIDAPGDADYGLTVLRFAASPTDTPTATPVPWDACEINDFIDGTWSDTTPPGGPFLLSVGVEKEDLNFVPYSGEMAPNNDYFTFLAKAGRVYSIRTEVFNGADTEMWLYDPANTPIAYSDDAGGSFGAGSYIELTLGDGFYKILVRDRLASTSPDTSQTYDILIEDVTPFTPTPTRTPAPGTGTATSPPPSIPGVPDIFEPNFGFANATLIGLDTKYTNLNFVPWTGIDPDTDFYKLWVTGGRLYTCETSDLGAATNTNIIFCRVPPGEVPPIVVNSEILSRMCFAGNDDVLPFDPAEPYRSRLTFFSSANEFLYLVLGQVGSDRILPGEWADLSYSLRCFIDLPGTATPTPTSEFVPPTPRPTATPMPPPINDTATPVPTRARIVVRPMTEPTAPPPAPPAATATPELYVIEVSLYYDRNRNGWADPGEGISDVLTRVYDAMSGDLLAVDYTDEIGTLRLTLPGQGPMQVSIPFFGFNQVVTSTETDIQIRISPHP